jgi:hypothetical protein
MSGTCPSGWPGPGTPMSRRLLFDIVDMSLRNGPPPAPAQPKGSCLRVVGGRVVVQRRRAVPAGHGVHPSHSGIRGHSFSFGLGHPPSQTDRLAEPAGKPTPLGMGSIARIRSTSQTDKGWALSAAPRLGGEPLRHSEQVSAGHGVHAHFREAQLSRPSKKERLTQTALLCFVVGTRLPGSAGSWP